MAFGSSGHYHSYSAWRGGWLPGNCIQQLSKRHSNNRGIRIRTIAKANIRSRYEQTPPSGVPSYCAEPENADLYECASRVSDSGSRFGSRQSQYRGIPGSAELPEQGARYPAEPYTTGREGFPPSRTDVRTEPPTDPRDMSHRPLAVYCPFTAPRYLIMYLRHLLRLTACRSHRTMTVGPGDEIDINIWGQVNFRQPLTVDRAGDLFIPGVGPRSCGRRAVFRSSDRTKECDRTSL